SKGLGARDWGLACWGTRGLPVHRSARSSSRANVEGIRGLRTETGTVRAITCAACFTAFALASQQAPDLEPAITAAYQREFNLTIPRPAIFNDPAANACDGTGHLTTTAYIRTSASAADLYVLYMPRDGSKSTLRYRRSVLAPAGTIRVLAVIIRHPETTGADPLPLWEPEQRIINEQHAAFATAHGYATPLVTFENTNVVLDAGAAHPNDSASVRAAVAAKGLDPATYRIVMTINIDPERGEGGLSLPDQRWIYVGNYSYWKTPLQQRHWSAIARTAYHHEMAHHWGWDHGWSPSCGGARTGYAPFIAPPVLFGWEDVDGDGVPEILDDTPYGRSR